MTKPHRSAIHEGLKLVYAIAIDLGAAFRGAPADTPPKENVETYSTRFADRYTEPLAKLAESKPDD